MKRTLQAITAALLVLSMAACSTPTPTDQESQGMQTEQMASQPERQPEQETLRLVNYGSMRDTDIRVEDIELTSEWDKVFPLRDEVNH